MKKNKKIVFSPTSANQNDWVDPPVPAINLIPQWYKKLSRFYNNNDLKYIQATNDRGADGSASSTKLCMPFFDALTGGYMYVLAEDLHVNIEEDGYPILSWDGNSMICDKRNMIDVSVPYQHHPIHFGWKMNWHYETPKGYSLLLTHPLNRHDLPFTTLSGIVDSDIWGLPVFISFFLKQNFSGIIPKGTPIIQMIPIKRDNWEMEIDATKEKHSHNKIEEERRRTKMTAYYKGNIWKRKSYQ